jgi:apolipoprotein N-acyltransferase
MNNRHQPAVEGLTQGSGFSPACRRAMPVVVKVLLSSVGGAAAYASPVSLPVLFLTARSRHGTAEALLWAVLAAATALETAWVLTFVTVGQVAPWIWLLPILAAIAAGAAVFGAYASSRSACGFRRSSQHLGQCL